MLLSILPATIRVPLDGAGYPSLTAIVRPLDGPEAAQFHADFGDQTSSGPAMVALSRQQLQGIDGLEVAGDDGARVPFDPANADHFRALPVSIHAHVWLALMDQTTLTDDQRGKSGALSASNATPRSARSRAGRVR